MAPAGTRGLGGAGTEHRREVIEAALAHVVGNEVTALARSDLFARRRLVKE